MTRKEDVKKESPDKDSYGSFKEHKVPVTPAKTSKPSAPEKASRDEDGGEESGGPQGPEPTRYGDWERKGICVDF